MPYPVSTGRAAQLLDATEPQLSDLVRHGKVRPKPLIIAGRRQWFLEHLLQAADALGILTADLQEILERAVPRGGSALNRFTPQDQEEVNDAKAPEGDHVTR